MVLLTVVTGLASYIDYLVGREGNPGYARLFYFSDIPITLSFFILSIFAFIQRSNVSLEPFFSGACCPSNDSFSDGLGIP